MNLAVKYTMRAMCSPMPAYQIITALLPTKGLAYPARSMTAMEKVPETLAMMGFFMSPANCPGYNMILITIRIPKIRDTAPHRRRTPSE
jgi:hypothetical protein